MLTIAVLALFLALPLWGQGDEDGVAVVPLAEYLELVERIEEWERAKSRRVEPAIAELVAASAAVEIAESSARIVTAFRVELRGTPSSPVELPFAGLAERLAVEPESDATLHRRDGAVVLVAPQPGSYAVTVDSVAELEEKAGPVGCGRGAAVAGRGLAAGRPGRSAASLALRRGGAAAQRGLAPRRPGD